MGQLALSIFSGLLVLLNAGPLYWQLYQGNSGPIAMGVWVIVYNLMDFVNNATWFSDNINRAPIWCDISSKIGGSFGRIASGMCIARFLAAVVSPRATAITRQDRRQRALFDYSLCIGVPFIGMACHIIYQPIRFILATGRGCAVATSMTWPTLVLWTIWPPIFAVIGVLYSAYTFYRLVKHRHNFGRVVAGAHSALTTTRFVRLAGLSFSYLAIGLPLCVYSTMADIAGGGAYFDYSWSYLHSLWKLAPVQYVDSGSKNGIILWSNVIVGFIFFSAFGFGTEALSTYSRAARAFGFQQRPGRIEDAQPPDSSRSAPSHLGPRKAESRGRGERNVGEEDVTYGGPFHVVYAGGDTRHVPGFPYGVKVLVEREEAVV